MAAWFKRCLCLTWSHRTLLCNPNSQGEPWGLQYLFEPVEYTKKANVQYGALQVSLGKNLGSYKRSMADYKSGYGKTFTLPVSTGCSYVRFCAKVVRVLRELYNMTVKGQPVNHPLCDIVVSKQQAGSKRSMSSTSADEFEGQAKKQKVEFPDFLNKESGYPSSSNINIIPPRNVEIAQSGEWLRVMLSINFSLNLAICCTLELAPLCYDNCKYI